MDKDFEFILGIIIAIVLIFGLGFGIGGFTDECIKSNSLAQVLYKDTDKYLQHRHDNFYKLLKLVEIKKQECIKRK